MRALAPARPAAAVAVFAVNFAGMWLSGSRRHCCAVVIGTIALAAGVMRERRSNLQRVRQPVLWITGVLPVLIIMVVAGTTNPIQRALDIPPGRAGLAALWNRGGYGPIALR